MSQGQTPTPAVPSEDRTAHPYYMYEAIRQQPERVARVLTSQRATLERAGRAAVEAKRILLAGIGTSQHAALVGEHFLRHLTAGQAHAQVEHSFELVHYPLALGPDDAAVVISHRGWKNYSVRALAAARQAGARTLAITGENGGEGMQAADFVVTTCEQEISSAHTKSYTTALAALACFAIHVAARRGQLASAAEKEAELARVPQLIEQALACEPKARQAAKEVAGRARLVFLGAGPNWATAREGALKVKETSYVAAEGIETEDFLHGSITELDSHAALVAVMAGGPADERLRTVLNAVGELGVLRIAVATEGASAGIAAEHVLEAPRVAEWLSPLALVAPIQLLSYFLALERGCNPDNQRRVSPDHIRAHERFQL